MASLTLHCTGQSLVSPNLKFNNSSGHHHVTKLETTSVACPPACGDCLWHFVSCHSTLADKHKHINYSQTCCDLVQLALCGPGEWEKNTFHMEFSLLQLFFSIWRMLTLTRIQACKKKLLKIHWCQIQA